MNPQKTCDIALISVKLLNSDTIYISQVWRNLWYFMISQVFWDIVFCWYSQWICTSGGYWNVVISYRQSIFRSPFDSVKLLKNQAKTVNPFKKSTFLNLKWFQKLILCPKVRRKPMKKRTIHTVVCEYFEEAFNAAFRH